MGYEQTVVLSHGLRVRPAARAWSVRARRKTAISKKTIAYAGGEGKDTKNAAVVIHHNDHTEIYVNDQKIIAVTGSKGNFMIMVTEPLKQALKKLAYHSLHSHEKNQSQIVNFAILME